MTDLKNCLCGLTQPFHECCEPILQGLQPPETAEQLLRARYCAFPQRAFDFLLSSHHSSSRAEVTAASLAQWAQEVSWVGLSIKQSSQGQAVDQRGEIIFCATYLQKGVQKEHWEHSFFEKEDGIWRFLNSKGVSHGTVQRSSPKIGRNDPCVCGSLKKYKKCCALLPPAVTQP